MPNTYSNLFFHVIFSTKGRVKNLNNEIIKELYPYICGIAKNNNFQIISINGVEDHIHILLSLSPNLPLSKAVQYIKGNSSKWIHECFLSLADFAWQVGYGAFSVSSSHIEDVKSYISNKKIHHENINFKTEYRLFLQKNNIDFDERYLF